MGMHGSYKRDGDEFQNNFSISCVRETNTVSDRPQAQLDQQRERDLQAEVEVADKGRRHQLLVSTKEGLEAERARIRLLVRHYLPASADVDGVLDGAI